MQHPKIKLLVSLVVLLTVSATCSGFLVGRTVKLHEEGKFHQLQQVSEQVIDVSTVVWEVGEIVRRTLVR